MRILALDCETAPMVAYLWQLKQDGYVTTDKIVKDGYTLCWSAKWVGEDGVMFGSIQRNTQKQMLKKIHELMDEADAVLTFNGSSFDLPILNKNFIEHGFSPPAPYKGIDLYRVAKNRFRFSSNKLNFIAQKLGLGKKLEHKGMELWSEVMAGNKEAWKTMRAYNEQDVLLLEKLYFKMLPWIKHPNQGAFHEHPVCPNCASKNLQKRGFLMNLTGQRQRYQCRACGAWMSQGLKDQKMRGV